eukprot:1145242-Pelagomonas_calceolata.AAC.2
MHGAALSVESCMHSLCQPSCKSLCNCFSHSPSCTMGTAATYTASDVPVVAHDWRLLFHDTATPYSINTFPLELRLVLAQPA